MTWNESFIDLFERSVKLFKSGDKNFQSYYVDEDKLLLHSIGCRGREFFDYVEDSAENSDGPGPTTALLIAAARRDYFHVVLEGEIRRPTVDGGNLPSAGDKLEGIAYLPRLLAKARGKLAGELDPEIMFGCSGDRKFLRENGGIHPADFLRRVWAAGDDDSRIAAWVARKGPDY